MTSRHGLHQVETAGDQIQNHTGRAMEQDDQDRCKTLAKTSSNTVALALLLPPVHILGFLNETTLTSIKSIKQHSTEVVPVMLPNG